MYQNILVPLDGSPLAETVLPHVTSLARVGNPVIHFLSVVETLPPGARRRAVDPFDWVVRKAEATTYLQAIAKPLEESGLTVRLEVREGKAVEEILEYTLHHQIDLLMIASHGQSGHTGWTIGSTVQKLVGSLYTSIFLVPATFEQANENFTYPRILVPLDGSARAECVLPSAAQLGRAQKALLILAHVVEHPKLPGRMPPAPEDLELVQHLVARQQQLGEIYLNEVQARLDANTKPVLQVANSTIVALLEIAAREAIDLVLLCAHGHTGASDRILGTTGLSLMAAGRWPLLIMQDMQKPGGLHGALGAVEEGGSR